MATSQNNNNEAAADPSAIKRKLAWRMGVAGLMIVALLGGLALFDYLDKGSGLLQRGKSSGIQPGRAPVDEANFKLSEFKVFFIYIRDLQLTSG